jgi:hypothetical protein
MCLIAKQLKRVTFTMLVQHPLVFSGCEVVEFFSCIVFGCDPNGDVVGKGNKRRR